MKIYFFDFLQLHAYTQSQRSNPGRGSYLRSKGVDMNLRKISLALIALPLLAQAPMQDRIRFPQDYQRTYKKLLQFDRPDNGQVRTIWANPTAAAAQYWESFPYGSILLFESAAAQRDAGGNIMVDQDGHFIPGPVTTVFIKQKEAGWGAGYGAHRNGEWEYMAFRPDGAVTTTTANSMSCAVCHLEAGPPRDWTFRRERFGRNASGIPPTATMSHYRFIPGDVVIKKGTRMTWYNDDEVTHQIFVPELSANSEIMSQGADYSLVFWETGVFDVRCIIHAGMRARVTVVE
jgi:plastocyanin